MKKLIVCASAIALAACGGGEAEPEAMEDDGAMEETAMADDSAVVPGSYTITTADGESYTTVVNADGTFTAGEGEDAVTGTVAEVDGKACFDTDGDDEGPVCWTNGDAGEDGSFTSTADSGDVVKVVPQAAE